MPLYTRVNPGGWVSGNLLTPAQINGIDIGIETVGNYVDGLAEDVTQYGATGDGVTDDTAAIQDALDAAEDSQVPVYFPPGDYLCGNLTLDNVTSLRGVPGNTNILCNHATNPIITEDSSSGSTTSVYPTRVIYGIRFAPSVARTSSILVRLKYNSRTIFEHCDISDGATVTAASADGLVHLGDTGVVTRAVFLNCSFAVAGNNNEQAIGWAAGVTHVDLINCRFKLDSSARTVTNAIVRAAHVRSTGTLYDVSAAAATTYLTLLMGNSSGSIVASGNRITDISSGSVVVFAPVATCDLMESANRIPDGALLVSGTVSDISSVGSRVNRYFATTQSGGGSKTINPNQYGTIFIDVTDNTAFTLIATGAWLGAAFDLVIHASGGSGTGTITWGTSTFAGFSSADGGTIPPPSVVLTGRFMTARFVWSSGPDGARWYPVGSALAAT